jgi:hypothetical protein
MEGVFIDNKQRIICFRILALKDVTSTYNSLSRPQRSREERK